MAFQQHIVMDSDLNFMAQEDELVKAIASYRAEADTCSAFVNFLEATWALQSSFMEQNDKKVKYVLCKSPVCWFFVSF